MRRIKWFIPVFFGSLTLLWVLAENFQLLPWSYFPIRKVLMQYSGILAMATMSIIMLLALRLKPLEKLLNGLDKSYRLHKWLGISSLVFILIHWFWTKGSKYLVNWGLLDKPGGKGRMLSTIDASSFEGLLHSLRHSAESVGEWSFYVLLLLIAIALFKKISYPIFLTTHKLMSVVYLLFVFHSLVLVKFSYWQQPIGWFVGLLIVIGCWAAIQSLIGNIGQKNKIQGHIESFHFYKSNHVLSLCVGTSKQWPGHEPGQFAFVTFLGQEPHPFTIASMPNSSGSVRFHIKAIGDFTDRLNTSIKVGDPVTLEGPYGCFNFKSKTGHQIWVAGGIGIAAFTARMEALVNTEQSCSVDLFYCTQSPDPIFIQYISSLAKQANVKLHLWDVNKQGFLNAKQITEMAMDWADSDVWFCGPQSFSSALQHAFDELGLSKSKFHYELFQMR